MCDYKVELTLSAEKDSHNHYNVACSLTIESSGCKAPIFYRQVRMNQHGKPLNREKLDTADINSSPFLNVHRDQCQ